MNGLENLKVGDKVTGLNTHGMNAYLTQAYTVARVTETLVIAQGNGGLYSFRIRIKDGTSTSDGKHHSTHYYNFNHPTIESYRKANLAKIDLDTLKNEISIIMKNAENKFALISELEELVKKNQLALAL